MGLFSSHHHPITSQVTGTRRLLVYMHSPVHSHDEEVPEPSLSWSLCVEQPAANTLVLRNQRPEQKRSKGIFSLKRKTSVISDSSDLDDNTTLPRSEFVEFAIKDGNLQTSHPNSSYRQQLSDHQIPEESDTILLKIQIPFTPLQQISSTSPSTKLEQILLSVTSASPHLTNAETEIWLRYSLIAIQQANLVPQGNAFNINNFINFAQNKFTEFEAEVLAKEGSDDTAVHTKEIDYQAHLDENARLRALFGHDTTAAKPTTTSNAYGSDPRMSGASIQGGMGGKWWVSRPQYAAYDRRRDSDDRDPYGGLM